MADEQEQQAHTTTSLSQVRVRVCDRCVVAVEAVSFVCSCFVCLAHGL